MVIIMIIFGHCDYGDDDNGDDNGVLYDDDDDGDDHGFVTPTVSNWAI